MLESIQINGYRSLREFRLKLKRVTVVTGGNGVGKSNVYRALSLLQRMAEGRFAESLATEGGMPSALWAGERRKDESRRISWEISHSDFDYTIECGMVALDPESKTLFRTDPEMKSESLRFSGKIMARRRGPVIEARNPDGMMESPSLPFHAPESMISELRDGIRHPAVAATRETLLAWRFYHQFRSDADSPLRRARLGSWSPVLSHDGANLAAALLSLKPPPLLVLNEPEASLHSGLIEPLARLIAQVPHETQIIVVTHSQALADLIAESCDAKKVELVSHEGETRTKDLAGAKRAWSFD